MYSLIVLLLAGSPVVYVAPMQVQVKVEVVNVEALISLKAREFNLNEELVQSIIYCESRGKIDALGTNKNGTTDKGLLQINSIHDVGELDLFNPEDNLDFGLKMMSEDGTRPWNSSRKCWG